MTDVLGLKLEDALKLLAEDGHADVKVNMYCAPRAEKDPRGTLRVVRFDAKKDVITVCPFNDDVFDGNEI